MIELPATVAAVREPQTSGGWTPPLDIYQNADHILALVELPGLPKEEIEISLHDGVLTISGERKPQPEEIEGNAERTERQVGKFRRCVSLATRVDASRVVASYRDGILTVTLPKAEETKPRKIEVSID